MDKRSQTDFEDKFHLITSDIPEVCIENILTLENYDKPCTKIRVSPATDGYYSLYIDYKERRHRSEVQLEVQATLVPKGEMTEIIGMVIIPQWLELSYLGTAIFLLLLSVFMLVGFLPAGILMLCFSIWRINNIYSRAADHKKSVVLMLNRILGGEIIRGV